MAKQVKRKRTERMVNRTAIIAVTVVIVSLALVVGLRVRSLRLKEQQYKEKEQNLIAQIAEQEERAEQLEEYRVYVTTKQYIEKVAKEKLGLVYPDETVLKPNEQ